VERSGGSVTELQEQVRGAEARAAQREEQLREIAAVLVEQLTLQAGDSQVEWG